MVYKRKAKVLFVGYGDTSRALIAAAIANDAGQGYMLARAAGLQPEPLTPELQQGLQALGLAVFPPVLEALDASDLAWADLLVTLDVAAARACPPLPAWVQTRCYAYAPPENPESLRPLFDALQQRVAGMLGGMAMIA